MNKIKYCIWDVGGVIYDYSLDNLHQWCKEKTNTPYEVEEKLGRFNYNDYMKGKVSFPELCQQLCDFYDVTYKEQYNIEINKALHQGIGEYFPETRQAQEELLEKGIKNCILSNALPAIAEDIKCKDLMQPEHIFCSFDLGLLKPDVQIYQTVLDRLECEGNEVIFVDDKPKNTAAAATLGIHAVTYNRNTIVSEIRSLTGATPKIPLRGNSGSRVD